MVSLVIQQRDFDTVAIGEYLGRIQTCNPSPDDDHAVVGESGHQLLSKKADRS